MNAKISNSNAFGLRISIDNGYRVTSAGDGRESVRWKVQNVDEKSANFCAVQYFDSLIDALDFATNK